MPYTSTTPAVVLTQRYADAVAYASSLHAEQALATPLIDDLEGLSTIRRLGEEWTAAFAGLYDQTTRKEQP